MSSNTGLLPLSGKSKGKRKPQVSFRGKLKKPPASVKKSAGMTKKASTDAAAAQEKSLVDVQESEKSVSDTVKNEREDLNGIETTAPNDSTSKGESLDDSNSKAEELPPNEITNNLNSERTIAEEKEIKTDDTPKTDPKPKIALSRKTIAKRKSAKKLVVGQSAVSKSSNTAASTSDANPVAKINVSQNQKDESIDEPSAKRQRGPSKASVRSASKVRSLPMSAHGKNGKNSQLDQETALVTTDTKDAVEKRNKSSSDQTATDTLSGQPRLKQFCTSYRSKPRQTGTTSGTGTKSATSAPVQTSQQEVRPPEPAGPVVRIVDGEIVLQESSLVVAGNQTANQTVDETEFDVVEEEAQLGGVGSTYASFRKNPVKATRWSVEETRKFYEALRQVGQDFGTMEAYFDFQRTRKSLKQKFRMESNKNPKLVEAALNPKARQKIGTLAENLERHGGLSHTLTSFTYFSISQI